MPVPSDTLQSTGETHEYKPCFPPHKSGLTPQSIYSGMGLIHRARLAYAR